MGKKRITIMVLIIILFLVAIILSFIYYNGKYTVSFETGTKEIYLTKYINENSKVSKPKTPEKEGYVFIEWQLNGEKYDFDNNVDRNIILSAKWVKEEYITVNYDTDSSYSIEPIKILKGSSIDNLPVAYKDGYEFIGWNLNNKLYNNEDINDNVTLVAVYMPVKKNIEYKVGDRVIIVGNYSESAYSISAPYKVAIGWDRQILKIIENSEYPYMIGNETGVTGFFKEESIKIFN